MSCLLLCHVGCKFYFDENDCPVSVKSVLAGLCCCNNITLFLYLNFMQ